MSDLFDQLENQLSDSDKKLDEVTTMIKDQESRLLAKIDSLQAELSKKMDDHHKETQKDLKDIKQQNLSKLG